MIVISEHPIDPNRENVYCRKIGDTEMIVENIHPKYLNEEERDRVKAGIKQTLFEVFSKYVEDC